MNGLTHFRSSVFNSQLLLLQLVTALSWIAFNTAYCLRTKAAITHQLPYFLDTTLR